MWRLGRSFYLENCALKQPAMELQLSTFNVSKLKIDNQPKSLIVIFFFLLPMSGEFDNDFEDDFDDDVEDENDDIEEDSN